MRQELASEDTRTEPVVVDLAKLEEQAESLYLHRFVQSIKRARKENGRFLTLRAGDQLAIEAAQDGSSETLRSISVQRT
ncbi:MAG: hypothetical protein ACR2KQ_03330 [Actinomycetota bacterium]